MRAAILSSVRDRSYEFLRAFVATPAASETVRAAVMQDLGQLFGAGQTPERCLDLIMQITELNAAFAWQPAALSGIAQGLRARGLGGRNRSAFMTLLSSDSPAAHAARQRVERTLGRVSALALDDGAPADQRLAAIELMGHTDFDSAGKTLEMLLAPRQLSQIQIAAIRALAQLPSTGVDTSGRSVHEASARLVQPDRWLAFTPQVREEVLSVLMAGDEQTMILLDAVDKGAIAATALGPSRRRRLTNHRNASIQKRARELLAEVESGDQMQVYERRRGAVLALAGRGESGKNVFARQCASCHTFDGAGGQLGPDLSGIGNQPADAILLHVLVPAYEITPGYEAYVVETRDGRTLSGRLESEAPNSLTLRDASSQHRILRSDVVSMSASPGSLMPNEMERAMSAQDLANLIAYLKRHER
jgi:putative heme-binding domain-containing protein